MCRPTALALAILALGFVSSGCRCTGRGPTVEPGELSIVYLEGGVTKTSTTGGVYDFGPVPMGKTVTLQLTVKNTGSGALFLTSLEKTSGDAVSISSGAMEDNPIFRVDFSGKELGAGEVANYVVTFNAPVTTAAAEAHDAKLTLHATNTASGEGTASVELKGSSVSGECDLPDTLDYGAVARGDRFGLSVTLENTRPIPAVALVGALASNTGDDRAFTFSLDSPQGEVQLEPAQKKIVTLFFAPTETRDYLARVTIRKLDGCPDKVVKLIGTGVDNVLTWAPTPLDFGYVSPGLEGNADLTFKNLGLREVTVRMLKPSTPDYRVLTADPLTVPPASRDATGALKPGATKSTLAFKPTVLGPRPAQLAFFTDLPKQPAGSAPLKGYGGGPDIDVKPSTLNFGRVAYFAGASPPSYVNRKLVIQNAGTSPTPPDPRANLHLGVGGTGGTYWEVKVKTGVANNTATLGELCVGVLVNGNCTNLPVPLTYDPQIGLEASAAKGLLEVPIRVTPASVGIKEWEVTVFSNDPDQPAFPVTVHAEAIVVPPCNFTVSPSTLNYGLVTPPAYTDLSFTITNHGVAPGELCLISSLDLKTGSDPIFDLPNGPLFDQELLPGASLTVPVRAWPQGVVPAMVVNVTGAVSFNISNPITPEGTVSLTAAIAQSCLTISPRALDFGTVQKDCSSSTRTFTVYNTCATPVLINGSRMDAPAGQAAGGPNCPGPGDCPEFIPVGTSGIAAGVTIAPGASPLTFTLKYHPIDLGPDTGAFVLQVTQTGSPVSYVITLAGNGDLVGLNTDVFKQDTQPKADILLVIDDSCSMADKQASLSVNFNAFIQYAVASAVDYQIAVTTSDVDIEGGKIVGDVNNPKVLKPSTPDVANKFKAKVNVGINGSGIEQLLAPAVAALTAPLITSDNAGLLRADAFLAVVAITDAADQSPQPVTFYVNQLLSIKGVQRASQFSFNAIAPFLPTAPMGCSYDDPLAGADPRTLDAVQTTNGVKDEICTSDWAKALQQIGKNAFGYRTNFYLTSTPDLSGGKTITVMIDGLTLAQIDSHGSTVWTYDPVANSVNFEALFVPEPGKTLTITYFAACIP